MGEGRAEEDNDGDDVGRYDNDDNIGILLLTLIIKSHTTIYFPVLMMMVMVMITIVLMKVMMMIV